jgi:hypothetical protein
MGQFPESEESAKGTPTASSTANHTAWRAPTLGIGQMNRFADSSVRSD